MSRVKDSDIIGLSVICSRPFWFLPFYVSRMSKIKPAKDLKGEKVGPPEWAHTAAVCMRGWLGDERGVRLQDGHWVQAGTNEPGRMRRSNQVCPRVSSILKMLRHG